MSKVKELFCSIKLFSNFAKRQMKICSKCNIELEESNFRIRTEKRIKCRKKPVYLNNVCYKCEAERQRLRTIEDRKTPEGRAKHNNWAREFHYRHREKVLAYNKMRRQMPGYQEKRKKYDKENKERIKELGRKRNNKYIQKMIIEEPKKYALRKLTESTGLPKEHFLEHPELIEAKNILLQLKRKIKNHGN